MNFEKGNGLITAVVQDAQTDKVLMVGYMNEQALLKSKTENRVTFFSRSKNRLWTKGETSSNFLDIVSITQDCDQDAILIKAKPNGPTCHTGADTCFNEPKQAEWEVNPASFLFHLEQIIAGRKSNPSEASYTSRLFGLGINKVAQKVGEEAVELVIEAKDDNRELFLGEAADLMFHYLVLLQAKGFSLAEVVEVEHGPGALLEPVLVDVPEPHAAVHDEDHFDGLGSFLILAVTGDVIGLRVPRAGFSNFSSLVSSAGNGVSGSGGFGQPGGDARDGDGKRVGARAGFNFRGDGHAGAERFFFLHPNADFELGSLLAAA